MWPPGNLAQLGAFSAPTTKPGNAWLESAAGSTCPPRSASSACPLPAECRFDEYTADIPLNRILRGAAVRLLRLPGVTIPTRQALQRLAAQLGEAGLPRSADLQSQTVFTRLNEYCLPAEHLARMILGNSSLIDAAGPGIPGCLPGAGGRAVAVEHLGLAGVPRGGGTVGVQDQGPAPPVDDNLMVKSAK